ncbi:MAG TPA: hypothetical protein VNR38_23185 [Ureibacillus sp.]|nr:hypothetical protein [Ureibacillus sp.]
MLVNVTIVPLTGVLSQVTVPLIKPEHCIVGETISVILGVHGKDSGGQIGDGSSSHSQQSQSQLQQSDSSSS